MAPALELSATYARLVLQSERVAPAELLAGTGLDPASLAALDYLPWQAVARLFRNYASQQPSPAWTAELGAQFSVASHGPLGFAALSAPTLGEALSVMATYHPVRNAAMRIGTDLRGDRFLLTLEDLTGDPEFGCWLQEIVFKILESMLATMLGHPVGPNVVISFTHPAPAYSAVLAAGFTAGIGFSAPIASLSVPAVWCRLPSPLYDEALYRSNIARCQEIMATRDAGASTARRVRLLLGSHFERSRQNPAPAPTLEQLAARLYLTPRTLVRHLQREDTSYRDILESLRQDQATRLLRDARLTVAEVGEILGYREQANFGRAFRRWFGRSPAAWRRQ